jgi:hypothetical protein
MTGETLQYQRDVPIVRETDVLVIGGGPAALAQRLPPGGRVRARFWQNGMDSSAAMPPLPWLVRS